MLISTALVLLASIDYVKSFKFFRGEYYFLVMMSALGMMFMASAQDLLSVFVTLEFSTFGFYVLVAYLREDQKSSEAGLKFFILGVFAAGLLAYGISLVYGETGTLVFSEMASAPGSIGLAIGFIMIFAALGFKIGAVPFHSWIPDTYQGSPHARHRLSVDRAQRCGVSHSHPHVLRRAGNLQTHVGPPVRRGFHPVHDLRQHRGHCPEKHQTATRLFRHCANRQRYDRPGGRNQTGQ